MPDLLDALRRHLPETVEEELRLLAQYGLTSALFVAGEDPRAAVRQALEQYLGASPSAPPPETPGRTAVLNALHHQALLATLERHGPEPAALAIAQALAALAVTRQVSALTRETADLRAATLRLGGTIAHELRSPLTALHGALNVLGKYMAPPADAPSARMVEIAIDSGNHLVKLVDGLLDAERLASGEPSLVLATCEAGDLLGQVGTMMGALAARAEVTLAIAPCQATVMADADRLRQALVILLTSAIQAAHPGSRVRLQADCQGDTLCVGLGIDAPWPALTVLALPPGGALSKAELAALDLVIARQVIERHSGRLSVAGESALCVSLPTVQASDEPLVLVCDEDTGYLEVVEAFLAPRGLRVLGVRDAHAMLALAGAQTPAVILLNESQATPEVFEALRRPGPTAEVPIVHMCMAGATPPATAAHCLEKPFKKAALIAAVGRAMGASPGGAP